MAIYDGISEFVKSGQQRLRDAEELLQPPTLVSKEGSSQERHLRGADYLAGYGIECLLKAYIIHKHPPCLTLTEASEQMRTAGVPVQNLTGKAGHNLAYLLKLTGLEGRMSPNHRQDISLCAKWSSEWRYNPNSAQREDVEARVAAARRLVNWVISQI